jgi:RNA polymerase sigma-70 factor (ECF subfamily)
VENNEDANLSLVESYGPLVWRTLCTLLRSDDGIADCFQDTFLEFLRLAKHSPVQRPAGLLMRIATRRAIDRVRKRWAERQIRRPLAGDEMADDSGPAEVAIGQELAEALLSALATLPKQQSATFVMTQLEAMSHEEVAAAMGIRVNHVGVLLFRARVALRQKLKVTTPVPRK